MWRGGRRSGGDRGGVPRFDNHAFFATLMQLHLQTHRCVCWMVRAFHEYCIILYIRSTVVFITLPLSCFLQYVFPFRSPRVLYVYSLFTARSFVNQLICDDQWTNRSIDQSKPRYNPLYTWSDALEHLLRLWSQRSSPLALDDNIRVGILHLLKYAHASPPLALPVLWVRI